MFCVGDYIMYGKCGVCKLTDICRSPFDAKDTKQYYELRPISNVTSVIYTPVDNDKIMLRKLMDKDDAQKFLDRVASIAPLTVENEKKRRDIYKEAIADLYPDGYVSVIRTVYERRRAFEAARRHITDADSEFESLAKRSLFGELSIVLGIPVEQVEQTIFGIISESETV